MNQSNEIILKTNPHQRWGALMIFTIWGLVLMLFFNVIFGVLLILFSVVLQFLIQNYFIKVSEGVIKKIRLFPRKLLQQRNLEEIVIFEYDFASIQADDATIRIIFNQTEFKLARVEMLQVETFKNLLEENGYRLIRTEKRGVAGNTKVFGKPRRTNKRR